MCRYVNPSQICLIKWAHFASVFIFFLLSYRFPSGMYSKIKYIDFLVSNWPYSLTRPLWSKYD